MSDIANHETLNKELRTLFVRIAVLLAGGVILGLAVGLFGAPHLGTLIVGLSFGVSVVLMLLVIMRYAKRQTKQTAES